VPDGPECTEFQEVRASVVSPLDPAVKSSVNGIPTDELRKMLSGGTRLSDWWTIDFDATGTPTLNLKDMPMRDGPRGVHHVSTSDNATTFAIAEARAASFDLDLEYRVGVAAGRETRAFKYDVLLAPTMNVLRHPAWGRAQETYGEDPILVGEMAAAFTRGVQDAGTIACPKHFALNNTENNRGDPGKTPVDMRVDQQTLHENYLKNFQIVVEKADPGCIMASYNKINGTRMAANGDMLNGVLRGEWHWDGFVVSDWWATDNDAAQASLEGGLDLEMPDDNAFDQLASSGVSSDRLREAAARIVNARVKFKHDTPAYQDSAKNPGIVSEQSHKDLARETAEKGAVLLKNADAILPLAQGKSIVVLGPDRNRPHNQVTVRGNPSGLGDRGSSSTAPAYAVSVLKGLQDYVANAALGITVTESADASAASSADIAIIPVTMDWEDEGENYNEGKDRVDLYLSKTHPRYWDPNARPPGDSSSPTPDSQYLPAKFIADAAAKNPNVVVLLMVGSAIIVEDWIDSAKGIVQTFYPGQEGGNAIASLLFGEVNFSGKLPFTVAKEPGHYPEFGNTAASVDVEYLHGYRRFEANATAPRYWFGFGLSYTKFDYGDVKVLCSEGISKAGRLAVSVPVTNTGERPGDEVVQLYISYPGAAKTIHPRPAKELKAFTRVHLEPGETKDVELVVSAKDLAYWDEASGWQVESGEHRVLVGPSADPEVLKSQTFTVN
jgi:beta-glucosidase